MEYTGTKREDWLFFWDSNVTGHPVYLFTKSSNHTLDPCYHFCTSLPSSSHGFVPSGLYLWLLFAGLLLGCWSYFTCRCRQWKCLGVYIPHPTPVWTLANLQWFLGTRLWKPSSLVLDSAEVPLCRSGSNITDTIGFITLPVLLPQILYQFLLECFLYKSAALEFSAQGLLLGNSVLDS